MKKGISVLSLLFMAILLTKGTFPDQKVNRHEVETFTIRQSYPLLISIDHYREKDGWTPVVIVVGGMKFMKWMNSEGVVTDIRRKTSTSIMPIFWIDLNQRQLLVNYAVIPLNIMRHDKMSTRVRIEGKEVKARIRMDRENATGEILLFEERRVIESLYLKKKKLTFLTEEIEFVGKHVLGHAKYLYDDDKKTIYVGKNIPGGEEKKSIWAIIEGDDWYRNQEALNTMRNVYKQNTQSTIQTNERNALIALYNSTNGDGWSDSSNWKKSATEFNDPGTENTWYGVTVETRDGGDHVTRIDLEDNNLIGTIPSEIGDLPFLEYLDLSWNYLYGPIPDQLGNLTNLRHLDLNTNEYLEWGNPSFWLSPLTDLRTLNLEWCYLGGVFPLELEYLTELYYLSLEGCRVTGPIPSWLGSLFKLSFINLNFNPLEGTIPPDLGDLSNLGILELIGCKLTGDIPPELGNLSILGHLDLRFNDLTGSIPSDLSTLSNLWGLELDGNQLTGNIPTWLSSLTSLGSLGLADNQFMGVITDLSSLENLTYLTLGGNLLTAGPIPSWIATLKELRDLYLHSAQFTGNIPDLSGLTELRRLFLNDNLLEGSLPSWLGNLDKMYRLLLSSNMFAGNIPSTMLNLTKLANNWSDFRWNSLYTDDDTLRGFLNSKQINGDWESTQTVAPTNVTAIGSSLSSIDVSWDLIEYISDGGHYKILISTISGGPYLEVGQSVDKTEPEYEVVGLIPYTTYYFVIQTQTDPHANNRNTVLSQYSEEATAQTRLTLEIIIAQVEALIVEIQESNIQKGVKNSLIKKLENAIKSIKKGNLNAAINQIEAFQNEVRAQRGKKIPEALADQLLSDSDDIIQNLENL